jgi:protocatechuate 3,4-dioxygenase beta subunit
MTSDKRRVATRVRERAQTTLAGLLGLAMASVPGSPLSESSAQAGPSPVVSVGILAFQDDSGSEAPPELRQRIARDVQRKLNTAHGDLLARVLEASAGGSAEELAAVGRRSAVAFVVRGGLVGFSSKGAGDGTRVELQLYADVLSVESGKLSTVRASGAATGAGTVELASLDPKGEDFAASALGQALAGAVEQLAVAVHEAVVAPALPQLAAAGDAQTAAASDEELQQLIGQASALMASGSSMDPGTLQALSTALEALNTALTSKASLLEHGQPTAAADQKIALRKQALQVAVSAATERVATQTGDPGAMGSEKKSLLASLGQSLGETSDALAKIQEIRSMLRGAEEGQALPGGDVPQGGETPAEEPLGEVSGVVTESGEPVEGVTVTDPESGATATTNESGSYTLPGLIPGRLTKLVLTKQGKSLALSQVDVLRGRMALADFELKPGLLKNARPVVGGAPSTVVLQSGKRGALGQVSGVVRDAQGRPVPRTLVSLQGLGVARTDSQGRYTFINVPPGSQHLLVQRPGMKSETRAIQVPARGTSQSNVEIAPDAKALAKPAVPQLFLPGGGAGLRGTVKGSDNRPLGGVKITAMLASGAVSTFTDSAGRYALKDIKPGPYKLVVSKLAYETAMLDQVVRSGKQETRDFKLKASPSALASRLSKQVLVAPIPSATPTPTRTAGPPKGATSIVVRPQPGALRGTVADANTGRPVSGASVSLSGGGGAVTSSSGAFAVGNLAPGSYQVLVRRSGYLDATASMTVRAGQTASVSVRLTPQSVKRVPAR